MSGFIQDLQASRLLQYALLAGLLSSFSAGVVGSLVVVRRTTYLAGAISHCVLAGLGLARYLQRAHGIAWMTPMTGAVAAAILAAAIVAAASYGGRHRSDSVLSAVWAVGMAIGVSFMAVTPGYQDDLMSYLFGSILMVGPAELGLMAGLDVVVIVTTVVCYNRFLAIGFSEETARLRGVPVMLYDTILLVLTALTIVLLVKVAGIILALALLTLPAATAGLLTRRLGHMMLVAVLISMAVSAGGLALSYGPDWPAGATIVELAAALYILVAWIAGRRRK